MGPLEKQTREGQGRGRHGVFSGLQPTECSQGSGPSLCREEGHHPAPLEALTHRIARNNQLLPCGATELCSSGGTDPGKGNAGKT